MTTTLNKTLQTLLAHQAIVTAAVIVGSEVDVSTKLGPARVIVRMGRTIATALTNNVKFRIEVAGKSSGNDSWVPIAEWTSFNGLTAASATTLNDAAFTSADSSATLTSATGFAAGDQIYFRETGTPADSEFLREKSVSSNTVTFEEPSTRAHTNGITVTDLAEAFNIEIDLTAAGRVRLVVDTASAASGQTVDVVAWLVTADSTT